MTAYVRNGLGVGMMAVLIATPGLALPPDPQRAFTATDCSSAQARLSEARQGNPLISDAETQDILIKAQAQALHLCATPTTDPTIAPATE